MQSRPCSYSLSSATSGGVRKYLKIELQNHPSKLDSIAIWMQSGFVSSILQQLHSSDQIRGSPSGASVHSLLHNTKYLTQSHLMNPDNPHSIRSRDVVFVACPFSQLWECVKIDAYDDHLWSPSSGGYIRFIILLHSADVLLLAGNTHLQEI